MNYYIVKVSSDDQVETIKKERIDLDLKELQKLVDGYIEVVSPIMLREVYPDLKMIINESGKLYDLPVNRMGTALYGNPDDCIVGNIVFCTTFNPDPEADPDIYAFDQEDYERLISWLPRLLKKLKNVPI